MSDAKIKLATVWLDGCAARHDPRRVDARAGHPFDDLLAELAQADDVARANNSEGVGVSEAPRGTLLHHYKVDKDGLVTWANLIIATGRNNSAVNRGVLQVARHFVHGHKLQEGMLNRVEAVIRAFDLCLSCSTHAAGQMALELELRDSQGTLLDRQRR